MPKLTEHIYLRFTPAQKRMIEVAAALEGVSMSEFIRRAALCVNAEHKQGVQPISTPTLPNEEANCG